MFQAKPMRVGQWAAAAVLTGMLMVTVAAPTMASGGHERITRGDVSAAFQARTTGGYLNGLKGHTIAAPVRGLVDGRINFFTDGTYCARDWHYLGVTLLGTGGRKAAGRYLDQTSVAYRIDGVAVSTMRTAVKPFVGMLPHGQFGVSVGALIRPGSLSSAAHTLETDITTPDGGTEVLTVSFDLTDSACG